MKKLYTFGVWERPLAGLFKDRFEQEGIACLLKNYDLVSVMGEIPMIDIYPELWIVDSEAYPRAKMLLDSWLQENQGTGAAWTCPDCREQVDAGFDACWNCNRPRPEVAGDDS